MGILRFFLELYFAAILGTAGFAKLDHPQLFLRTLQRLRILPNWSAVVVSRVFPVFEIGLAFSLLLTMQPYKLMIAFTVLLLFIIFFLFNIIRNIGSSSPKECGCYGRSLRSQGFQTERTALFIQLLLSGLLVALSLWAIPLASFYYLGSAVLFTAISGLLGWRIWQRHRYFARANQPLLTANS